MNLKRLGITIITVFITILATDFLVHHVILKDLYMQTASLWRPEMDMSGMFPWIIMGQFFTALFFSIIFVHGYKGGGVAEGVRYGILIGGLNMGSQLIMYGVQPFPLSLTGAWIFFCFVQSMIAGVVAAKVWPGK